MQTVAAIDVGERRIGLAICLCGISIPQNPIFRKNRNQASSQIKTILSKLNVTVLVVGLPNGKDRDIHQKKIKHFVKLINFDGKIIYQDEDFSSFEAKQITRGKTKHKKDGKLDSIAAKIILDRFLSAH